MLMTVERLEEKYLDHVAWSLYDTVELKRGQKTDGTIRLFDRDLSKIEGDLYSTTNVWNKASLGLPPPWSFEVLDVAIAEQKGRKYLEDVFWDYRIEIWLGQNIYWQKPMSFFPIQGNPTSVELGINGVGINIRREQSYGVYMIGKPMIPKGDCGFKLALNGILHRVGA